MELARFVLLGSSLLWLGCDDKITKVINNYNNFNINAVGDRIIEINPGGWLICNFSVEVNFTFS